MNIRSFNPNEGSVIQGIMGRAFAGPPWYEALGEVELLRRWVVASTKPGFCCIVAEDGGQLLGASWWDTPSLGELAAERGDKLAQFVQDRFDARPIVWIRDTIVDPQAQGRGIAGRLKSEGIVHVRCHLSNAICLTRMRADNKRIIAVNERAGFLRTGIRVTSSTPGTYHEYWYLALNP